MKMLLLEQIIVIITVCIYLSGFMDLSKHPYETVTKVAEFRNMTELLHKNAPIKKTVIMVIDALRTDHLVNSNQNLMEFSRGLLKSGKGFGYMVHTETPTVTLPRIKSLLTGTIPGFMDVIFNFAAKQLTDENLVHFWTKSGRKVRFYGDDTWLSLFPDDFDQWKGITSFYVNDYTQVDTNVTEHLVASLPQDGWDVMILHYLGLDHIGHLRGPSSDLIPFKLKEMDAIIQQIYLELQKKNETFLLLVCGDHGMSDGGGHGGASASEILTSAMLVSNIFNTKQKVTNSLVHQVDLASTLAILTGVPIPNKNIGVPLHPVLDSLPLHIKLLAEHELTTQLVLHALTYLKHVENEDIKTDLQRVSQQHSELLRQCDNPSKCSNYLTEATHLSKLYADLQRRASNVLAENKHTYDVFILIVALAAISMVFVATLMNELLMNLRHQERTGVTVIDVVITLILCLLIYYISGSISIAMMLSISLAFGFGRARRVLLAVRPTTMLKPCGGNFLQVFIFSFVILHPVSLLATSFVEEEHQVFYFLLSSLHCLLCVALLKSPAKKEKELRFKADSHLVNYTGYLFSRIRSISEVYSNKLLTNKSAQLCVAILSWMLFRNLRYYNATGDKWRHLKYFNNILADFSETVKYPLLLSSCLFSIVIYSPFMTFVIIFVELMPYLISSLPYKLFGNIVKYVHSISTSLGPYPIIFIILCGNLATLMPSFRRIMSIRKRPLSGGSATFSRVMFCFECFFALLFIMLQKQENHICTLVSLVHFHLLLDILLKCRVSLGLSDTYLSIIVFWLADAHFFAHGNSNSLTTVRIASGFIGVTSYHPFIHGFLIAIHTFGSKIIIFLHFIRLFASYGSDHIGCTKVLRCWWIMQLIVLNMYIFVVTIQRHHLFIWSVFAPKLLYEGCHVICLFVVTVLAIIAAKATEKIEEKLIA